MAWLKSQPMNDKILKENIQSYDISLNLVGSFPLNCEKWK